MRVQYVAWTTFHLQIVIIFLKEAKIETYLFHLAEHFLFGFPDAIWSSKQYIVFENYSFISVKMS